MLQKIIIILFAIVLILFNSVGKERINRKLLIFLSSIIVLNAILLIVRQVIGKEMELFSFLAIDNNQINIGSSDKLSDSSKGNGYCEV